VSIDIRDAAGNDAEAIAHIYNQGIEDRVATLETTPRSADDRYQRGRGIGEALLQALQARARAGDFHKMVLAAFPTNAAGMRLYQRRGFSTVGIYKQHGLLDGRWVDVIVMEKLRD